MTTTPDKEEWLTNNIGLLSATLAAYTSADSMLIWQPRLLDGPRLIIWHVCTREQLRNTVFTLSYFCYFTKFDSTNYLYF